MSRYFDDELIHSGVKGMKWKRHKYKLVKDANGKLHYIYDLTNKNKNNNQNTNLVIRQAEANKQQVDDRKRVRQAAAESKARAAESTSRHKTAATAQAEANKAQAERSKRIRQAEANRQQVIDRKIKKQSIQAYEDWIKEGQRLDRAKATTPAEKRKNADEYRKHDHRIETVGYSNVGDDFKKSMRIAYYKKDYATGDTSRYTERFNPSKETKKRLRRNKRKKAISDGKRFIEGFFKKKR